MKKLNRGFTLLEVLVTLAVVSLVASVVFVGFDKARKTSYDSKTLNDISQIQLSLQLYYQDHGFYPSCPDQKEACCIGTDSCYSIINQTEIKDTTTLDLYKTVTSLNTTKPNATANLAAAATWYWNTLGPIRYPGYVYGCENMSTYIDDEGTIKPICIEGTLEYSNAEGDIIVQVPAGDSRDVGWVAPSVAQNVVAPGGGCLATDPNALWDDGSCDSNNEPGVTLCNDSRSPDYGNPVDCRISSLPIGSGICWGTNTPTITCESQSRFGVGPGWSNGTCVVSQGTYYNNVQQAAAGYGCGYTTTPTGGTGGNIIDEADDPVPQGPVYGCTDGIAFNYNPDATDDMVPSNCEYHGCMTIGDPAYDSRNTEDTSPTSCVNSGSSSGSGSDLCQDGLAGNYGMPLPCEYNSSSSYVISGCTDPYATNYNSEAAQEDGSCTYDSSSSAESSSSSSSSSGPDLCQDTWADNYGSAVPCEYSSSSSSS